MNVHHARLRISLPLLHDYNVKAPNYKFHLLWRTNSGGLAYIYITRASNDGFFLNTLKTLFKLYPEYF